ncbi:hypothetical protein [Rathayibacter soli]|uniref:hypothetical protein n=1 Tax=Rathayibacter soli TaxID=3144168 RepID=UPI0027E51726|nr:hypothetical protein [Glaciibacter superstes]
MSRLVWAVGAFAVLALLAAAALEVFTLSAQPAGVIAVNGSMTPVVVMLSLVPAWIRILMTLGLTAGVGVLFALAVHWDRRAL